MLHDPSQTTVAQLLYPSPPPVNFARLVSDLDAAIGAATDLPRRLSWDHDDVSFIDVGASRVALAYADGLAGDGASLTVSVGHGPGPSGDAALADRQDRVARHIVDRIAGRLPPRQVVWSVEDEVASADLFDRLAAEHGPAPQAIALPATVERLLRRMDAALAARASGEPDAEPANDRPELPAPDRDGLRAVREALDACREAAAPSMPVRVAAVAMDATLLVVMLPLGAAALARSARRGADLRTSGRLLALGGIWVGALQAVGLSLGAAGI